MSKSREIEIEKSLERWDKRCANTFTKNVKRMMFGEIDNVFWSGKEKEITRWCQRNREFDEITEKEIEEIWQRDNPGDAEEIRLNGKNVWDTVKRVYEFINAHEDTIKITSFEEYRVEMRKVTMVIKEAHNIERKIRQALRKNKSEEVSAMTPKAKTLIDEKRRGGLRKEDVGKRRENIFGNGSSKEIEKATTSEKNVERIEEMSKRE